MTARRPSLLEIVRVLEVTYTDAGILIWLNAKNRHLLSKPDGSWTCSPAQYIEAGHTAEVYELAQRVDSR